MWCFPPGAEEERAEDSGVKTDVKPEPETGFQEEKLSSCCSEETDKEEKSGKTCTCRRESSASSEDSALSPDKVETVSIQLAPLLSLRDAH